MHLIGFWISGGYVPGAASASRLPSRPRAVVAQQIVPVRSGPGGDKPTLRFCLPQSRALTLIVANLSKLHQ
jgi:hypothetical protein